MKIYTQAKGKCVNSDDEDEGGTGRGVGEG